MKFRSTFIHAPFFSGSEILLLFALVVTVITTPYLTQDAFADRPTISTWVADDLDYDDAERELS